MRPPVAQWPGSSLTLASDWRRAAIAAAVPVDRELPALLLLPALLPLQGPVGSAAAPPPTC